MKILFCARHHGYFRNYEPVIVRLAAQGHRVHLAADRHDALGGLGLVERLASAHPGITFGEAPSLEAWPWDRVTHHVRHGLEAVRFSDPAYDDQPKYRRRSAPKAPAIVVRLGRTAAGRRLAGAALRLAERGVPPPPPLLRWLGAEAPDVVLLASVTNDGAPQMDHLKAALALGLPVSLPVYSWDHLSGKAPLHIAPGQVLVWNEALRREAVELHGLPPARIVVTGAYGYEPWFTRSPSVAREAFMAGCGFDPNRPLLVYVCSVLSRPAPPEAPFVLEWIRAVRQSDDPDLREAGILVRPHPERTSEWSDVDLSGLGAVAVRGRNPIDAAAKAEYFDTLYAATAVVGIITSAFIEAAVAGRPSLTIEDPRFREHQEGAPHYHRLRDPRDGLLLVAGGLKEHLEQLRRVVRGDAEAAARTTRFVDAFVRPPTGSDSASDVFVQAVERLAAGGRQPQVSFGRGVARVCAELIRAADRTPFVRRLLWNARDRVVFERGLAVRQEKQALSSDRQARRDRLARERADREAVRAAALRDKQERMAAHARQREEAKAAHLRERQVRQGRKLRQRRLKRARKQMVRVGKRLRRTVRHLAALGGWRAGNRSH